MAYAIDTEFDSQLAAEWDQKVREILTEVSRLLGQVSEFIKAKVEDDAFVNILVQVGTVFYNAWTDLTNLFTEVVDKMKGIYDSIISGVRNTAEAIYDYVTGKRY